jgi:two-component system, OmpR family, alkaline phosphatase synthesis response regulator PhoP
MTFTEERHRALLVEDDAGIRRLVERLLQRRSIEVDSATDGQIALEKLKNGRYTILILDLMVPKVNGFEIIDFIKREKLTIPVAVVSAVSQQALTRLDLDIVKVVIPKPFDVEDFTRAIIKLCETVD